MGKIIDKTVTKIVTEEGISLFRRVTKVLMPNGKYRYVNHQYSVRWGK